MELNETTIEVDEETINARNQQLSEISIERAQIEYKTRERVVISSE
jgi:hypothetical protein